MKTRMLATLSLLALVPTGACDVAGPDGVPTVFGLMESKASWDASGIDSYRMVLQVTGALIGEVVEIEVINGHAVRRTYVPGGEPVREGEDEVFRDVEGLFDMIHQLRGEAYRLEVRYHPRLGYPTRISFDFFENLVDDEATFEVLELEPL